MNHPKPGRPKKPPNEKKVKVNITLTPEHMQLTAGERGQRCKVIEAALKIFFMNTRDFSSFAAM